MSRKRRPQTSKRKRKDELRDLDSLHSRAKAVLVFVPHLCILGLCLQGLGFRGLRFQGLRFRDTLAEQSAGDEEESLW